MCICMCETVYVWNYVYVCGQTMSIRWRVSVVKLWHIQFLFIKSFCFQFVPLPCMHSDGTYSLWCMTQVMFSVYEDFQFSVFKNIRSLEVCGGLITDAGVKNIKVLKALTLLTFSLFRVVWYYPNPYPKLRVPKITGTRNYGYGFGYRC